MGFELDLPWWFLLLALLVVVGGGILVTIVPNLIVVLLSRLVLKEFMPDRPIASWPMSEIVGVTGGVSLLLNLALLPTIGIPGYLVSLAVIAAILIPRWSDGSGRQTTM